MGWSGPMPNAEGREVGYAVEATCDLDGCDENIDRGLAFVCGGMHDGGEHGCGGYFCAAHLYFTLTVRDQLCGACVERLEREEPEMVAAGIRRWYAVVEHACPTCGAEPKADCREEWGGQLEAGHPARLALVDDDLVAAEMTHQQHSGKPSAS